MFALPCRLGGLSIYNLSEISDLEYKFSQMVTEDLANAIYNQESQFTNNQTKLSDLKLEVTKERTKYYQQKRTEIMLNLSTAQILQLDLASKKVPAAGSLHCHCKHLDTRSTSSSSQTLWLSDMPSI